MLWRVIHQQCSKELSPPGVWHSIENSGLGGTQCLSPRVESPQYLVIEDVVHSKAEGLLLPQMLDHGLLNSNQLVLSYCRTSGHCSVASPHLDYQIQLLSMAHRSLTFAHLSYTLLLFAVSQAHILFNAICLSPALILCEYLFISFSPR